MRFDESEHLKVITLVINIIYMPTINVKAMTKLLE